MSRQERSTQRVESLRQNETGPSSESEGQGEPAGYTLFGGEEDTLYMRRQVKGPMRRRPTLENNVQSKSRCTPDRPRDMIGIRPEFQGDSRTIKMKTGMGEYLSGGRGQ